jgi:hypothetical protein
MSGAGKTWSEAKIAWNDPSNAGRTIAQLSATLYSMAVDRLLSMVDIQGQGYALALVDAFTAVETSSNLGIGVNALVSLSIDEAMSTLSTFVLALAEATVFIETLPKSVSHFEVDGFHIDDVGSREQTLPLADSWSILEQFNYAVARRLFLTDLFQTAEETVRHAVQNTHEGFQVAEVGSRIQALPLTDGWALFDALSQAAAYHIKGDESFHVDELGARNPATSLTESFTTGDVVRRDAILSAKETLHVQELYTDMINFILRFMESVKLAENASKVAVMQTVDRFSAGDAAANDLSKMFYDALNTVDVERRDGTLAVPDAINTNVLLSNNVMLPQSDAFHSTDGYTLGTTKDFLETLTTGEALKRAGSLKLPDGFATLDTVPKRVTLPKAEAFTTTERSNRQTGLNVITAFSLQEAFFRSAQRRQLIAETLTTADRPTFAGSKAFAEAFRSIDHRSFGLSQLVIEMFSIAESVGAVSNMVRKLQEVISVGDLPSFAALTNLTDGFGIFDGIRKPGDFIISDIMLSSDNMDLAAFTDFMDYGNVPGYERWRDFIPGEYDYAEAMFRAVINSNNSDRGFLTGFQVTVDVPDLIDRGTAVVITAAIGIRVLFVRNFHIVPEMTLAIKGGVGMPGTPKITAVDLLGFNAIIEDASDFSLVTGSFTWAAHGY